MKFSKVFYLWPTLAIIIFDQVTKVIIRQNMTIGQSIPIWGEELLRLTYIRNTGVAFGMQAGSRWFLISFTIVASCFLLYLLMTSDRPRAIATPRLVRYALALILGGAIGNLIDRIIYGRVTDFLDFNFLNFIMDRWPVFNVADSAVTVGVTIWIAFLILGGNRKEYDPQSQRNTTSPELEIRPNTD